METSMNVHTGMRWAGVWAALAVGLQGCGNGTGPEGTGHVSVALSQASGGLAAATDFGTPTFDVVPLGNVGSFNVDVTAVEVHRVGTDEEASSGEAEGEGEVGGGADPWIRIDLTAAGEEEVDMLELPEADGASSGFQIALEAVPAGTYNLLRLFFDGVSLSLLNDAMIDGVLYEAGTDLPLEIRVPSGDQTGILVQTGTFEVPAGGTASVEVIFDPENSLKNVTVTGNGIISVTPVMSGQVVVTQAPPEEGA
jgi:hypothetical protein